MAEKAISAEVMPKKAAAYSPDQITSQYRRAVAGALEMLRFGAMLIEVDSCCTRATAHFGQRNQYTGESLKAWLAEHCPEVNYHTAMRFRRLAEDMVEYLRLPRKLPVSLALPLPDGSVHTDDLPENVNKERAVRFQQRIWEMVQGSSARQLMFQFAETPKPRGGDHGGGKAYSEQQVSPMELKRFRAEDEWAVILGKLVDFVKERKFHLYLEPSSLHQGRIMVKECLEILNIIKV